MIIFRTLKLTDKSKFLQVFSDTMGSYFLEYSEKTRQWFSTNKAYQQDIFDLPIKLGAFDGEKLVAYIIGDDLSGGVFTVFWFAVLEPYQRRGIGTKLLQRFENQARKLGCHNLQILAVEKNLPFYKARGYEVIGLDTKSYFGVDYYVMKKLLQEPSEENFLK